MLALLLRDAACSIALAFPVFSVSLAAAQIPQSAPVNLARQAKATATSVLSALFGPERAIDDKFSNDSRWVSADAPGPHRLTLEFGAKHKIGCVQVATGWNDNGEWADVLKDFVWEYRDGTDWKPLPETVVTGNTEPVVSKTLTAPIETDALRLVARDAGRVRVIEVRVYAPAISYPALTLPGGTVRVAVPPLFVNQAGYNTDAIKRFTAPTLANGAPFVVRPVSGDAPPFRGTIQGNVGDFSAFRPSDTDVDYVVEAGGLRSDPFRVAPLWLERVSLEPALRFMVDARSVVGTHPSAYGGSPWRDGTYYTYEIPSLVMLYLANPGFFARAPVEMRYANDKARVLSPDFKLVAAKGDKGALEAARRYYAELDPPVGGDTVPDLIQLLHWGIGWHLMKPESADPSGDPVGSRVHPQMVEQFAFFLYGYPQYKGFFTDRFYQQARDFAFGQWEKVGLLDVITTIGDFKGRNAPGHSVLPNLLLYEVAKRENRPDADRYRNAAVQQADWLVKTLDPADPKVTKGQRMSEHMTITGLTALLRDYPTEAPMGLKSWLAKWADVMIARSQNLWDFRRYDAVEWSLPRGNAGWNEPGNIAGFPACALAVAEVLPGTAQAARLREIAAAHWDDLYGRNPLGAMAAYRGKDFVGVERGWPMKFSDDTCARLERVRGTINSTAATEQYPFNPGGAFRHPEGWTAFNSAFNVSLAYACRDDSRLTVTPTAQGWKVRLLAPLLAAASPSSAPLHQPLPVWPITLTTAKGDRETVILTDSDAPATELSGVLRGTSGSPRPGDGVLQTAPGDVVTATYGDGLFATRATSLLPQDTTRAAQTTTAPKRLLCFGDSIVAGSQLPASEKSFAWPTLAENKSHGTIRYVNAGKGGRPSDSYAEFVEAMAKAGPVEAVLLALGTNDSRDLKPDCAARAAAHLKQMIDHARSQGIRHILLVAPCNINLSALGPTKPIGPQRDAQLRRIGDAFRELARQEGVTFADAYGVVSPSHLTRDGVHPDPAGNQELANFFAPIVEKLLASSP